MSNQLQTNLDTIEVELAQTLLPKNIKKGVTILGVEGALENTSNVYKSYDEMVADKDNLNDGDLCFIIENEPIDISGGTITENYLVYLPETLPEGVLSSESTTTTIATFEGNTASNGEITTSNNNLSSFFEYSSGGISVDLYKSNTRHASSPIRAFQTLYNLLQVNVYNTVTTFELTISDVTADIWNYIKFYTYGDISLYYYDNTYDEFFSYPGLTLTAGKNNILSGYKAMGSGGTTITGTKDLSTTIRLGQVLVWDATNYLPTIETPSITPSTIYKFDIKNAPSIGDSRYAWYEVQKSMEGSTYLESSGFIVAESFYDTICWVPYDTAGNYQMGSAPVGKCYNFSYNTSYSLSSYPTTAPTWNEITSMWSSDVYYPDYPETVPYALITNTRVWAPNNVLVKDYVDMASSMSEDEYYINPVNEIVQGTNSSVSFDVEGDYSWAIARGLITADTDLSALDMSNVYNYYHAFACVETISLTTLDLSSWDTSNARYMAYMFSRCSTLTSLDISNFDTSNVTNMYCMFNYCSALTSLDLSNFDTSNVTNMQNMFYYCSALTSLNLSSFNTSKATNMSGVFYYCTKLTNLDLSNFDTSNVTTMTSMFQGCSGLTSLDLSNFDTSSATSMSSMFYGCTGLTSLDLSNFTGTTNTGTSSSTTSTVNVYNMFYGCTKLKTLDISGLDWRGTNKSSFLNCTALTTVYVKDEDSKTACDEALSAASLSITSTIKEV